jgi:hypothetical protein
MSASKWRERELGYQYLHGAIGIITWPLQFLSVQDRNEKKINGRTVGQGEIQPQQKSNPKRTKLQKVQSSLTAKRLLAP